MSPSTHEFAARPGDPQESDGAGAWRWWCSGGSPFFAKISNVSAPQAPAPGREQLPLPSSEFWPLGSAWHNSVSVQCTVSALHSWTQCFGSVEWVSRVQCSVFLGFTPSSHRRRGSRWAWVLGFRDRQGTHMLSVRSCRFVQAWGHSTA